MKEKRKQPLRLLQRVLLRKLKLFLRKLMIRKIKRNWKMLQRKLLQN